VRLPLATALARLRARSDRQAAVAYGVIGAAALAVALLAIVPALQREALRVHHARPSSTAAWLALQPLPRMYGGAHRAFTSEEPMTPFLASRPEVVPFDFDVEWVNHYPARLARLDLLRAELAARGGEIHLFLESRYRGTDLVTAYVVTVEEGRLAVRRRELSP
jgi:hypothetical protein